MHNSNLYQRYSKGSNPTGTVRIHMHRVEPILHPTQSLPVQDSYTIDIIQLTTKTKRYNCMAITPLLLQDDARC